METETEMERKWNVNGNVMERAWSGSGGLETDMERAWKLYLLLPRLILHDTRRCSKNGARELFHCVHDALDQLPWYALLVLP